MKARALDLARTTADPTQRLNVLREYVQAAVLRSFHESEAFQGVSFVGGTALRFLFGLQRFSEDLDFSLESGEGYDPGSWLSKVERDLDFAGWDVTVALNDRKTVHVAWVRVAEILREAGLSPLAEQKLSIKLEIDTRPPEGAETQDRVVNRHFLVAFRHHDLPSLMAGKVHALITRGYPKGRDWYDLLWYVSQSPRIEPNLQLLQSALDQTEGAGTHRADRWRDLVRVALDRLDLRAIRADVAPFLERSSDVDLLAETHLRQALDP